MMEVVAMLYLHATHILSFLPTTEVTSRGNADRDALMNSMEKEFTRAQFLQKAEEMGIKPDTDITWLKRMRKYGLVKGVDGRGAYRKRRF
ncbi:hypothetical protein LJC72_00090 [Bacteroides sp. OttesenSCG-928-D19]|nr:hypothetical protein [Bacteroides sp. OttesenSCG-928-D19]